MRLNINLLEKSKIWVEKFVWALSWIHTWSEFIAQQLVSTRNIFALTSNSWSAPIKRFIKTELRRIKAQRSYLLIWLFRKLLVRVLAITFCYWDGWTETETKNLLMPVVSYELAEGKSPHQFYILITLPCAFCVLTLIHTRCWMKRQSITAFALILADEYRTQLWWLAMLLRNSVCTFADIF